MSARCAHDRRRHAVSRTPRPRTPADDNNKPKTLPFVMVSCDVALNTELSDAAFRLYVILATFADINGRDGYAGRAAAATRMGKSKRTMTRLFKELEDKGVIIRSARMQDLPNGKQRQTTSDWTLLDHNETAGAGKNVGGVSALPDELVPDPWGPL